ncbi:MAG: lipoprotein [Pseudomonadota bacterium]
MLKIRQILVIGLLPVGAMALSGCGQRGDLVLPKPPAGTERASLPQLLKPTPAAPAASAATKP